MAGFMDGNRLFLFYGQYLVAFLKTAYYTVYGRIEIVFAYKFLIVACRDECGIVEYVGDIGTRVYGLLSWQYFYI